MKLNVSKQALRSGYGCREIEDALTVDKGFVNAFCELIFWKYIVRFEDLNGTKFIGMAQHGEPRSTVNLSVIEVDSFNDNLYVQYHISE